jgi:tetratricopeptide (TPR) repeat protein
MEINVYQQCPCHAEKKIKFCCGKEIVTSLNEVLEKHDAGQSASALDTLDRLIGRVGEKDCLATIRFRILSALGQDSEATATNERFLARNPNHALGLQQRSWALLNSGNLDGAIESLQDAIDNVQGNVIPVFFAKAFCLVGVALLQTGHSIAARAYAQFALRINPELAQAKRIVYETFSGENSDVLLKRPFVLPETPVGDDPWIKKYENVRRAEKRGQFRKARQILKKVEELAGTHSVVLQATAVLSTYFPEPMVVYRAWRALAESDGLQPAERVEAEAMAQLFLEGCDEIVDIVCVTYEIDDIESISSEALSHPRFVNLEVMEQEDQDEHGPPPRFQFMQLNLDKQADGSPLSLDTTPSAVADILIFGRQTDRPARLEWHGKRDADFDRWQVDLTTALPSMPSAPQSVEVESQIPIETSRQSSSWHVPKGTSRVDYMELLRTAAIRRMTKDWIVTPTNHLDQQSPRQAAKNPAFHLRIAAMILIYQLDEEPQSWTDEVADALYAELQLPRVPNIDLNRRQPETLTSTLLRFVDLGELRAFDLQRFFVLGVSTGHLNVVSRIAKKLIAMDFDESIVSKDYLLTSLAGLTSNDDECFEYLAQARKHAAAKGDPLGGILITEFEQRLLRRRFLGLRKIFHELQSRHLDEPGVQERFSEVLMKFGLLTREGGVVLPKEVPEKPAPESGKLWTPGEPAAVGLNSESGAQSSGSKLWIPGS